MFRLLKGAVVRGGATGFSLIEVVLALGISTFAILVIVSLLPAGIKSTKDSADETAAVNVMTQIIADRRATPPGLATQIYGLPALSAAATDHFGVQDNDVKTAQLAQARYRIDYIFTPPAAGSLNPYQAWFRVSWPANAATPVGSIEGVATFPQP